MCLQLFHICEGFALHADRDIAGGKHVDSGLFALTDDVFKSFYVVNWWFCVCHTDNGCKATGSGSHCSGMNVFFVGESRITEMHMDVDKSRSHHKTVGVNNRITVWITICQIFSHLYNFSIFNSYIHDGIGSCLRIDHPSTLNQHHNLLSS